VGVRSCLQSGRFSFDWWFKARTAFDICKRCEFLVRLIEKESEEAQGEWRAPGERIE
jgi:hypothetical protein